MCCSEVGKAALSPAQEWVAGGHEGRSWGAGEHEGRSWGAGDVALGVEGVSTAEFIL